MKTGIVLEIINGKATIMKNNGQFITVSAQQDWQKGDVVVIKNPKTNLKPFYTIAACFAIFISVGFYGYNIYFDEISLVSIDVNPSIELSLNRFDRVIGVTAHNYDAEEVINTVNVRNKKYSKALKFLIDSEALSSYIKNDSFIFFTVQSNDEIKENAILSCLQSTANTEILSHHQTTTVEYYVVDKKFVLDAHFHGVTAGKYIALLQLQKAIPTVDINEYTHHSITDIKTEIEKHQSGHDTSSAPSSSVIIPNIPTNANHNNSHH